MLTLHKLQNRMHIYTGREEAQSAERVGTLSRVNARWFLIIHSAKYIEGLENRLGRMESLLKMSGLLSDEDAGKTDLGTLEKRLAEKVSSNSEPKRRESTKPMVSSSAPGVDSHHSTPQQDTHSSPHNSITTPISKVKNEEVENLSDMMCSLVTNNCGETRYIGRTKSRPPPYCIVLNMRQDPRRASRSFLQKVSSGSVRRLATIHSRR